MADQKPLREIEAEIRAALAGGGAASVSLARLLDAIERAAPIRGNARAGIDSLASRLSLEYHINGPKGLIVFRTPAAETR